jgi:hypothetical protein
MVKKVSESYIDRHAEEFKWSNVKDKTTHEAGKIFHVRDLKWLHKVRVEASGGFHAGGLNGMSSTYTLARTRKSWAVVGMRDSIKN